MLRPPELLETQARPDDLSGMLENLPALALRLIHEGEDWRVVYVNRRIEDYGYEPDDLRSGRLGRLDLVHPEDRARLGRTIADYEARGLSSFRLHYRLAAKNGDSVPVTEYSAVSRAPGRGLVFYDSFIRPETPPAEALELRVEERTRELALMAAEAEKARVRAEEAARAKGRFLANMSHEIRTPMNVIMGMIQLAGRTETLEEIKDYLGQIDVSSNHLLSLLNEILDISKIEDGRLDLVGEPFNLRILLDNIIKSVEIGTIAKRQTLTRQEAALKDYEFKGDAVRLSQVLLNLTTNAVKFTPEGGLINLSLASLEERAEKSLFRFAVTDNGIGIEPELTERIFQPFEQVDNSLCRQYGGTGLGLAVSQRLVKLMGGEIRVESRPGRGSRFYFDIWLERADARAGEQKIEDFALPDLAGRRILIVDDVDLNRSIAEAFLKNLKPLIEHAENGLTALEKFMSSPPDHYSLILMDMQMPEMDGLAATRQIRSSGRPDSESVPIVAMTANAFQEDVQAALEAGMDAYITKPVKMDSLFKTLAQAMRGRRAPAGIKNET